VLVGGSVIDGDQRVNKLIQQIFFWVMSHIEIRRVFTYFFSFGADYAAVNCVRRQSERTNNLVLSG